MKAVAAFLLGLCLLAVSHAWRCREGPRLSNALQIDAGQGQVVATDRYSRVYHLSGNSWYRLGTVGLRHVSVGPAGLWGTSASHRIYKYVGGNFRIVPGLLQQVDAGGNGQMVGVNRGSAAFCLASGVASNFRGVGRVGWSYLGRRLRYYSCGPQNRCWGVDTRYRVYVTKSFTPSNCRTSHWIYVPGPTMRVIEVGADGNVFGLSTNGRVYQRRGISRSRPQGTGWAATSVCLSIRHLSYDLGQLWLVTNSGVIMRCTH